MVQQINKDMGQKAQKALKANVSRKNRNFVKIVSMHIMEKGRGDKIER